VKSSDSGLDAARAQLVARGLTAAAVAQLTPVVTGHSLENLASVKQLLKRFFSDEPWTASDDDVLAEAVGPGAGPGRAELDPDITLVWGWDDGPFRLRVERRSPAPIASVANGATRTDLERLFDGAVVPEATPSPRTIRFGTPQLHQAPSRAYDSPSDAADDARVARIFREIEQVTNVLVGPNFVAVTISRPGDWEPLLAPMLRIINEEFAENGGDEAIASEAPSTSTPVGTAPAQAREPRRLERAWIELGALRLGRPDDLDTVLAAAEDPDSGRRQVAAALLGDAPSAVAFGAWERLLTDPSRTVRRSTIDAIAGAGREELRLLLEQALSDADAWVRWKALRGIADLGVATSRALVEARTEDRDVRVRLEAIQQLLL
jgi:HEAT repeats/Scaffold protein Nfu/NifU N terminal